MTTFGTLTWQLLAAAFLAVTGVLLIAAAFSPESPAPFPAIVGVGIFALVVALVFLRLHLAFIRRVTPREQPPTRSP
ncbi:MAG: hypothetical protein R3291_03535 [Thermoplasmata archaeon]|nr:hypothetical protein [Thermoplasmata archaeon]